MRVIRGVDVHPLIPSACIFRRAAFSIVELLVCMAVVSLLAALLTPAVQSAREAARRTQCISNLRQMSQAASAFSGTHGHLPPYRTGRIHPANRLGNVSGHALLLPHLEGSDIYNSIDLEDEGQALGEPPSSFTNQSLLQTVVAIFVCPSDSVPPGGNSYRACEGTGPVHFMFPDRHDDAAPCWGAFNGPVITEAKVTDGLSQTAFFSERLVGDGQPGDYSPWQDAWNAHDIDSFYDLDQAVAACSALSTTAPEHQSCLGYTWLFSDLSQTQYNHVLTPNSAIPDCFSGWDIHHSWSGAASARSWHPGGVNVAFGDGAVRFVGNGIDLRVWRGLASRDGHEVIPGSAF